VFDMPFKEGNPGGPGRPRGSRNRINALLDQLAADNIEEIMGKLVDAARGDDRQARTDVLKRMWTVPKGRPVEIHLPPIEEPADLVKAHAAVVAAVCAGEITAEEASGLAAVLEGQRRAFELAEQEVRVVQLEDALRRAKAQLL
jgi:hypothetical protein